MTGIVVRIFAGSCWRSATLFDDIEFDVLPRQGEMLTVLQAGQWSVATVRAIAHRAAGHAAADVAMLVGPVRACPLRHDVLPFAALDDEEISAGTAADRGEAVGRAQPTPRNEHAPVPRRSPPFPPRPPIPPPCKVPRPPPPPIAAGP